MTPDRCLPNLDFSHPTALPGSTSHYAADRAQGDAASGRCEKHSSPRPSPGVCKAISWSLVTCQGGRVSALLTKTAAPSLLEAAIARSVGPPGPVALSWGSPRASRHFHPGRVDSTSRGCDPCRSPPCVAGCGARPVRCRRIVPDRPVIPPRAASPPTGRSQPAPPRRTVR